MTFTNNDPFNKLLNKREDQHNKEWGYILFIVRLTSF